MYTAGQCVCIKITQFSKYNLQNDDVGGGFLEQKFEVPYTYSQFGAQVL